MCNVQEERDGGKKHREEKTCVICLDQFENRPLEGLNCVYKELEMEFRVREKIQDSVRLEMNADLWKQFQGYVSENIDGRAQQGQGSELVEANGMHLFHRSCLRQYIQRKALELGPQPIKCPIYNIPVYSAEEKAHILRNIDELSSRMGAYPMSDEIAAYNTDELINLKSNCGNTTLLRYLQGNALGDQEVLKEDQHLQDETKGQVNPVEIDFLQKKGTGVSENVKQSYIDFAIKSDDKTFTPSWLAQSAISSNIFETSPIQCC